MSRLAQIWDQCYHLNEEELAFFAETQKRLSQPFILQKNMTKELNCNATLQSKNLSQKTSELNPFPPNVQEIHVKTLNRDQLARQMSESMKKLSGHLKELIQAHQQVQSKSVLMQSLWDGVAERQATIGKLIEELTKQLQPYQLYSSLYEKLSIMPQNNQPIFDTIYLETIQVAIQQYRQLSNSHHLDGPLYGQRYLGLLRTVICQYLLPHVLNVLEAATKLAGSRIMRSSGEKVTLELWRDINVDYLSVLNDISPLVNLLLQVINENSLPAEFSKPINQACSRYFSHRASLLHHFQDRAFLTKDNNTAIKLEQLEELIRLAFGVVREEKILADRFFGLHLEHYLFSYRKLIEGFLLPLLGRLKDTFEIIIATGMKESMVQNAALKSIEECRQSSKPVDEEQRRLLNLLNQFFNGKLGNNYSPSLNVNDF